MLRLVIFLTALIGTSTFSTNNRDVSIDDLAKTQQCLLLDDSADQ
ncbi:MAG: hypothetical protein ACRBBP_08375 [Bdellovibrionales bacterium]